jgi:holo-[acyl-carrier protein] synthase
MIFGIGTDILEVKRINKILNMYDEKFIDRIYGTNEKDIIKNKKNNLVNFLSKRFAAKEATWKAFNPKRGKGLKFNEIETLNHENGKPFLLFSGMMERYVKEKEKELRAKLKFEISLSDEKKYVVAFVVISLAPFD